VQTVPVFGGSGGRDTEGGRFYGAFGGLSGVRRRMSILTARSTVRASGSDADLFRLLHLGGAPKESDLSPDTRRTMFPYFSFFLTTSSRLSATQFRAWTTNCVRATDATISAGIA